MAFVKTMSAVLLKQLFQISIVIGVFVILGCKITRANTAKMTAAELIEIYPFVLPKSEAGHAFIGNFAANVNRRVMTELFA